MGVRMVERELQRVANDRAQSRSGRRQGRHSPSWTIFSRRSRARSSTRERCNRPYTPRPSLTKRCRRRAEEEAVVTRHSKAAGAGSGILIVGVDRLMTGLARCCKPAPPDAIVGFVTRGKGITIHRQSCGNVARMKEKQPERLISADWGTPRDEVFPVDVVVEAMDRQALLRDISEVFSREKINVTAVNTLSRNLQARMSFTLEVRASISSSARLRWCRTCPACFGGTALTKASSALLSGAGPICCGQECDAVVWSVGSGLTRNATVACALISIADDADSKLQFALALQRHHSSQCAVAPSARCRQPSAHPALRSSP